MKKQLSSMRISNQDIPEWCMSGIGVPVRLELLALRTVSPTARKPCFCSGRTCSPSSLGYRVVFLRRAYYRLTLDRCASNFYIGFGALFTHRRALVEKNAYIGAIRLGGIGSSR